MLGWFRRHAKILMVVLGSAAMAIFGLGPVFDELARGGGRGATGENEIVATWNGGNIKRSDLDLWERGHYQAQRFLRDVRLAAEEKKGDRITSLATPIPMLQDQMGPQAVDEQLVSKFLLSERAKTEGIIVSDGMVDDYIALTSGEAGFSNRDLEAINKEANSYCSLQAVKEHLKFELLATQMQRLAETGLPMVPSPTEAMELYSRTSEQVDCEVLPISVEKFYDQVNSDISTSEMKKVYDEGKYDFPDPTGEKPGFKIGRKVKVQYFKADYQTFLTNEKNKLTDAEVQKEYDRLVEEKSSIVMEPVKIEDDSITIPGAPPAGGNTPTDVDTPPPAEGDTPEPPPTPEGGTSETTTESPDLTPLLEEKPATPGTPVELPGTPAGEVTPESGTVPTPSTPPATEGDQSLKITKSKFQFVSTGRQEATDETAQVTEPVAGTQVETPVAEVQLPPVATPTTTEGVQQTPTTESSTPPVTPGTPETTQDGDETATPTTTQEPEIGGISNIMDDLADTEAKEQKPKPLSEVVDEVKNSMCQEKARKAMNDALMRAINPVEVYYQSIVRWEHEGSKEGDEPPMFDAEAIAKEHGLTVVETDLVDDLELLSDPIGSLGVPQRVSIGGRVQNRIVAVGQMIFNQFGEIKPYETQTVNDIWGSQSSYVFWLTEKADTRVPEFKEVEEEVKKFIKQSKAFDLAMEEAKSKQKQVNDKRTETMGNIFGEQAVVTGGFSWFTTFGEARYSMPNGVTSPGEEFMSTAFGLAKLEAGVAPNATKDTIYVIQAIEPARNVSESGYDFLSNQYFKYKRIPNEAFQVGQRYTRDLSLTWNEELQKQMNFKFLDR